MADAPSQTYQSTIFQSFKRNSEREDLYGAAEGTRTPDPIITNDVLYQLSYSGLVARLLAPGC